MNSIEEVQKKVFSIIEMLNVIVMSFAYIGLFFSGFITRNPSYNQIVGIIGWIIWILGLILAFSPNIVFKRRGGVAKGKSYVHTTKLVSDGIYGLVRHPQYTGGMVIAFSMCLIIQTPLTYILAIIAVVASYLSMIFEEKRLMIKFGSQYEKYKTEVPRSNLLLGLIR
ncbi:MAG: methyltransferase family protein, partial [Candidatus Hodarchaeota archaeon]